MAFKVYVPQSHENEWGSYWRKTDINKNLKDCNTDGLLSVLTRYLPTKGKILEAGCGLGKWVIFLKRRGYDICGVDSYVGVIKALKSYDKKLPVGVGSVEKLPFLNNSLAGYLSFGVVEHFEEGPLQPLREAFRVLRPGGIAVIETPFDNPLRLFIRQLKKLVRRGKPPIGWSFYEYHYTKEELIEFVREAGFKILASYPKDDLSADRSIGLWLDFPSLRKNGAGNFYLNSWGKLIKILFKFWPSLWSACVVVVAKKE